MFIQLLGCIDGLGRDEYECLSEVLLFGWSRKVMEPVTASGREVRGGRPPQGEGMTPPGLPSEQRNEPKLGIRANAERNTKDRKELQQRVSCMRKALGETGEGL